jgi:hypothetical protein
MNIKRKNKKKLFWKKHGVVIIILKTDEFKIKWQQSILGKAWNKYFYFEQDFKIEH